ncbi:unnamed protein product [Cochlearia groenlandica]
MDQPHVVLVASPGLGHLIPILELGNRISTILNVHVTVLAVSSASSSPTETKAIESATSKGCEVTKLPSVDIDHLLEQNVTVYIQILAKMRAMKPAVRAAMETMKHKPTVMIIDMFGTDLMTIADDLGMMAKYVYMPSNAWFLASMVYLPVFDKALEGEFVDTKEPMNIPGCKPLGPKELMIDDRSDRQYRECVQTGLDITMGDGVLVNTWEELEGNTLVSLREDLELKKVMKVPVYDIGPIIRTNGPNKKPNKIFEWLDKQKERSVMYVCLGSGGTLSIEQTLELALGLELSGQKFLWVLRTPSSYLDANLEKIEPAMNLPEGFLDRTRGTGLVVTQWAPQVEILSHGSIGGFLSHCGWNSVLESLTKGVPIVAWPLYAEQWMNATLLTEELGVAVRTLELPTERVIGRDEVACLVRKVLVEDDEEGKKVREKAKEVKVSSQRAWTQGGSSRCSFFEWAKRCRLV